MSLLFLSSSALFLPRPPFNHKELTALTQPPLPKTPNSRILGSLKNRHVVQLIDKIMDMESSKCYIIMEVSPPHAPAALPRLFSELTFGRVCVPLALARPSLSPRSSLVVLARSLALVLRRRRPIQTPNLLSKKKPSHPRTHRLEPLYPTDHRFTSLSSS